MKTTGSIAAAIASLIALVPCVGAAQDDAGPLYVAVDCMKSTNAGYPAFETDIWQPIQQELVNRGNRNSWALYWVIFGDRSRCDYYTVTTYLGDEQLNADAEYMDAFKAVHPDKDLEKEMAESLASREHISTELWRVVDSTAINDHRYAIVNLMRAEDPDAYERMESRVFKAGHQALADEGHRSGWAVYELVSPIGTSIPYNYSTVDFVNHLSPVPMAEALLAANPDRDLDSMHELLALREQVRSETWAMVTRTTAAESE